MSILPDLDGGTFGPDMMFEFFLRSSMESLKRLCFISRNWETFMSLPYFNKLYYERNPRNQCLSLPTSQNKIIFIVYLHFSGSFWAENVRGCLHSTRIVELIEIWNANKCQNKIQHNVKWKISIWQSFNNFQSKVVY